jgi:hypothetical protein
MTDYFLKLPTEADTSTALAAFYRQDMTTVVDPDTGEEHTQINGEPYLVQNTHDYAIDIVGVIYEPTGNMLVDDEGNEYPETAPLDGWHVNLRLIGDAFYDTAEAINAEYGVVVNSPARAWA